MRLNLTKNLEPIRDLARRRIDSEAEGVRLRYITQGDGQQMAYKQKEEEALAFIDNPSIDPSEVPHIFYEVGVTASTPLEVAQTIVNMRNLWRAVSARIERARLLAKKSVDEATSEAGIQAAANVDWESVLSNNQ